MKKKRVVITGMAVLTPLGMKVADYWQALVSGVSGIDIISSFDTTDFSSKIAGEIKDFDPLDFIDKKRAKRMDRFTQLAVVASQIAMKDSMLDMNKVDRERVGVIMGSGIGGILTTETQHKILLEKGPKRVSPFLIPMLIINMAAGEVAIAHGMKGPNYAISSACATSSHCIGDALRLLRYGDADIILAGGSEAAITPLGVAGFCSIKALSTRNDDPKRASRPFDKNRDGFVMSEGAGIMVLETLEHAQRRGARIYAELAGYWASDDAYHITAPDPTAHASAYAMKLAIEDADLLPENIDYINAHGTSTQYNDKTETLAIKSVFKDYAYKVPISSTKSMIGHLLGAAGAIEAIASTMTIQSGIIHPTINYEEKDPDCDLDYVPNVKRETTVNAVLSNSLGFGGHNASIVIKRFQI